MVLDGSWSLNIIVNVDPLHGTVHIHVVGVIVKSHLPIHTPPEKEETHMLTQAQHLQ